jgi:hypothetical protein
VRRAARGIARIASWAVDTEASSRSSALVRIGLALLLWARWGRELTLPGGHSPEFLLFACCFFVATTAMLLGVASRLATLATAALALFYHYYVGLVLGQGTLSHHTYLLAFATFLCALTPCGRSYSLDRWWAVRRAEREGRPPPPERGNVFGLRLIALQLSILYFWSAFDKSGAAFLSGAGLERIVLFLYELEEVPQGAGFRAAAWLAGGAAPAFEYALAFGLLFARTRRWLLVPGLLFHGLIYVTLPVRTFSVTMALLYLAYLDPDAVHDAIDRLEGRVPGRGPERLG